MLRSGYLRQQAETCLKLSQKCSNSATAEELRLIAAEFFSKAVEVENDCRVGSMPVKPLCHQSARDLPGAIRLPVLGFMLPPGLQLAHSMKEGRAVQRPIVVTSHRSAVLGMARARIVRQFPIFPTPEWPAARPFQTA